MNEYETKGRQDAEEQSVLLAMEAGWTEAEARETMDFVLGLDLIGE